MNENKQDPVKNNHEIKPLRKGNIDSPVTSYFDSLANVKIDTTTLAGKRQRIIKDFIIEYAPSQPDYDTLFDLNYDEYEDYVIGFYGPSGTGIKNGVMVYFFSPNLNSYILNEKLSKIPNPTFYIKQKKITGFYIGNGGGRGWRLEWLKNKWTTTKEFYVYKEGDTTKWKINYPLTKKNRVIIRPFQMIPPKEILESEIKW